MTDGGLTAKLDAISFELFLYACQQFYCNSDNNYEYTKSNATDKKGNIVQHTFHVQCLRSNNQSFTINAYTTRCSLLINGKDSELFLHNDIRHIHNIMSSTKINGTNIDVQRLNQCLAANLEQQALHTLTNGQGENVENKYLIDQEMITIKCHKCKRTCKTRGVECKNGQWVHYICDQLSEIEISTIEDEETTLYTHVNLVR